MAEMKSSFYHHRKSCQFCAENVSEIDYKDIKLLNRFVTETPPHPTQTPCRAISIRVTEMFSTTSKNGASDKRNYFRINMA